MSCEPTKTVAPETIDVPALREKYRQERDKRITSEATAQYVRTTGEFAQNHAADPHTPVAARGPISADLDVAVLGAGWTGLLASYHLRQTGISNFRNIDHAGGFGGVWYWNRYPGLQCDNDAYCYLPLLEETGFIPSKKFSDGFEILDYINLIATKYELGEKALFHTLVTSLRWNERIQRWQIGTNRGDDIRARFVIMAGGLLNIPKLPGIPGIGEFKGKMFHTARWDYQSTVDTRRNTPTDPEWVKTLQPGWQKRRQQNFLHAAMERLSPGEPDQICDIWTEINRNLSAQLAAEGWPEMTFEQFMKRREIVDYQVMERLRARVDSLVEDKATAESLKPWYRFLCKRPASNDDFYPTFNRPNVKLIDVSGSRGVERMTAKGFVANGVEYGIDCMIFASGFEVTSDLDRRWGIDVIEGRDGVSLYQHWADGYKTLHGMTTRGFPNQFFTGFIQSALNASTTEQMSRHGFHIAYIIAEALKRGIASVEPTQAAQDAWVTDIRATAFDISQFQRECTPSYFNGEGSKKLRWYAGETYGPGWVAFENLLQNWRDQGDLSGLELGHKKS